MMTGKNNKYPSEEIYQGWQSMRLPEGNNPKHHLNLIRLLEIRCGAAVECDMRMQNKLQIRDGKGDEERRTLIWERFGQGEEEYASTPQKEPMGKEIVMFEGTFNSAQQQAEGHRYNTERWMVRKKEREEPSCHYFVESLAESPERRKASITSQTSMSHLLSKVDLKWKHEAELESGVDAYEDQHTKKSKPWTKDAKEAETNTEPAKSPR